MDKTAETVKIAKWTKTYDKDKFKLQWNSHSESQDATKILIKYMLKDEG